MATVLNMSQFKVEWVENVTTLKGKSYKKATLVDERGASLDASVWPDFSKYDEVTPGNAVDGVIRTKGTYKNLVDELAPPKFVKSTRMEQAMEKKVASIENAQSRKENAIQLAGASRDATLIVTTMYPELSNLDDKEEVIKELWLKWQKWFLANHDNQPPF